jgi:signal transduction histidine kinase
MHLELSPCDMAAVAGTARRIVEPSARTAGIALAVDFEPGLPLINGDFERLVQVLVNLLSNAVKFAPAGSTVAVSGVRRDDALAVSVRDRGAGIAEEDLGKLLGRFKQLAGSAPRSEGGTGLGLSIVKALVEAHGGQVIVDSRVGEGSTFTVTLPIGTGPIRPSREPAIETVSAEPPIGGASLQATVG